APLEVAVDVVERRLGAEVVRVGRSAQGVGVVPVVAIAGVDLVAVAHGGTEQQATAVARAADQEAHFLGVAARVAGTAEAVGQFRTFVVTTGDDVDDAAD